MPSKVPLMPLAARPLFVRRLVGVWRRQHLAMGEKLTVSVWPGEWPAGVDRHVAGTVPVDDHECAGGPGGVLVFGRIGGIWRVAYNLAVDYHANITLDDLAMSTMYGEINDSPDMKLWLHPSPETGDVPMWNIPRKSRPR